MKFKTWMIPTVIAAMFGVQVVLAETPTGKTSQQVQAERAEAAKAGTIVSGECSYDMPTKATSTTTRAAVQADCAAAKMAGLIVTGEASYEMPAKAVKQ